MCVLSHSHFKVRSLFLYFFIAHFLLIIEHLKRFNINRHDNGYIKMADVA